MDQQQLVQPEISAFPLEGRTLRAGRAVMRTGDSADPSCSPVVEYRSMTRRSWGVVAVVAGAQFFADLCLRRDAFSVGKVEFGDALATGTQPQRYRAASADHDSFGEFEDLPPILLLGSCAKQHQHTIPIGIVQRCITGTDVLGEGSSSSVFPTGLLMIYSVPNAPSAPPCMVSMNMSCKVNAPPHRHQVRGRERRCGMRTWRMPVGRRCATSSAAWNRLRAV
ncbi:hypothetical protein [Saccharopolyspora spinosa]|uniref:hypothetical protein n=1 Tax=Saccharopolyspora spinosa TaxID=60894 RepID=UPI00030FD4F9|nr:hypothetical protein [Saccharopolyspora spinosa]